MAPRISVCRKGEDIFLTIKGDFNHESFLELLSVVRQLLMMSSKCAAPGSQVTYSFKTRGKVDLDKMAHFQPEIKDHPCRFEACGEVPEKQEQGVVTGQGESAPRQPRGGLILVKGGVG
jgi:hypothetical protein